MSSISSGSAMKPAIKLPADLAEVALIDAATFAAAGSMSTSWLFEQVRAGKAPQPVIRGTRCTRWRLADARAFWSNLAETGLGGEEQLLANTKKASAVAAAKRTASAAVAS